jgi:hypothetical protein
MRIQHFQPICFAPPLSRTHVILGNAVKEQKLSVDATVNIVIILCGSGATVVGRVQAKQPIYTPHGLPGPNIDSTPS